MTNRDDPILPYGVTVDDVAALLPGLRLLDTAPPSARDVHVTVDQVALWVAELSQMVELRCQGWRTLSQTPEPAATGLVVPPPGSDYLTFLGAARTVVTNGAASYVQAARHPEQARPNTDTYAGVLWKRFTMGLDGLASWLTGTLNRADDNGDGAPDPGGVAAGNFPPPLVLDGLRL